MTNSAQTRLWELAGKKIAGEANEQELEELQQLLDKWPDALHSMELIDHYWNASKEKKEYAEREAALEKHLQRIEKEQLAEKVWEQSEKNRRLPVAKRTILYTVLSAAAIVLLVLMLPVITGKKEVESSPYKTLTASKGTRNHYELPDGSKVWLNAGSTLSYAEAFEKDPVREVTLTGEAFFEIKHDQQHPFLIHTSQMDIRDLGTAFNVKAWPNEAAEATLIEGAIEVTLKNEKQTTAVLNKPNDKITIYTKPSVAQYDTAHAIAFDVSSAVIDAADSLLAETAWMKDCLVFKNESFADLARRMERWYDVTIEFENEEQKKYKLTGAFANESIAMALTELQMMKPFDFTIANRKIIIKKKTMTK